MKFKFVAICILAVTGLSSSVHAATLSANGLSVTIRNDNAAIDRFSFSGTDFFNPGTPVSDFGVGFDSTFFISRTTGSGSAFSVTNSGETVTGTGSFGVLDVTRTYAINGLAPVLEIGTTLMNTGPTGILFNFFETFDPDQGGFFTTNDVLTTAEGFTVSTAIGSGGLTSVLGSESANAIEAGGVFRISSLSDISNVLDTPVDGEGIRSDLGQSIVHSVFLSAGGSVSFDTYLAAGTSLANGIANYDLAASPSPVPLPAAGWMLIAGLGGLAAIRRRKKAS